MTNHSAALLVRIAAILERARVAGGWDDYDVAAQVLAIVPEPEIDATLSVPSKAEYPFKVIHRDGCGSVMFFLKRRISSREPMLSADVIYPDGQRVERETPVWCQACGKFVADLKTDWIEDRE